MIPNVAANLQKKKKSSVDYSLTEMFQCNLNLRVFFTMLKADDHPYNYYYYCYNWFYKLLNPF